MFGHFDFASSQREIGFGFPNLLFTTPRALKVMNEMESQQKTVVIRHSKVLCLRPKHSNRICLNDWDIGALFQQALSTAMFLLNSTCFRYLLSYVMSLKPHSYGVANQPTDFLDFDRKVWSYLSELVRVAVPEDATNFVYSCCMFLLASLEQTVPENWSNLLECFEG